MEPVAAVAEYKDGKVVCYANTQNPQAVQDTVTGRIQATLQSASVAEPFIKEGSLRPIAVAGSELVIRASIGIAEGD